MIRLKTHAFGKLIFRLIPLMVFVCLVGGCGSSQNAACPTDQQLIDPFNKNKTSFIRLQSDPDNMELHALLGIKRVTKPNLSAKPTVFWFEMWFVDFIGGRSGKEWLIASRRPILSWRV